MEVVPCSVEYMRNYNSPEEIAEQEKYEHEKVVASVFNSEKDLDLPASRPEDYVDDKDDSVAEDVEDIVNKIFEA